MAPLLFGQKEKIPGTTKKNASDQGPGTGLAARLQRVYFGLQSSVFSLQPGFMTAKNTEK